MTSTRRLRVRPIGWVLLAATFVIGTGISSYNSTPQHTAVTAQLPKETPQPAMVMATPPPKKQLETQQTLRQRDAAAKMIRLAGYDCQTVDQVLPYVWSEGFTVWCNHLRYKFEIENHGGRWSVKAP